MNCRGTTHVVMLALLSITQTSWSAEPTRNYSQTERIRFETPASSLKFAIRNPASRGLVGPATRASGEQGQTAPARAPRLRRTSDTAPRQVQQVVQQEKTPVRRTIKTVNHESVVLTPRQTAILVAQLGDDKAREALDALRSVSDDLDLSDILDNKQSPLTDLPDVKPDLSPSAQSGPATDVKKILEQLNREKAERETRSPSDSIDASRSEQRKRELESLLKSVEDEKDAPTKREVDLEDDLDDDSDEDDFDVDTEYVEPVKPESIYAKNTNYEQIPWTMGDMFEEKEKTWQEQCREQQMCQEMWACAGGKCMSPCDRWKRNLRRTYELMYGDCPNSMPFPLLTGFFVEPLIGYGFFGAPVGLGANGDCGCQECMSGPLGFGVLPGTPLVGGGRLRPGSGGFFKGGMLGGGPGFGRGIAGGGIIGGMRGGIGGRVIGNGGGLIRGAHGGGYGGGSYYARGGLINGGAGAGYRGVRGGPLGGGVGIGHGFHGIGGGSCTSAGCTSPGCDSAGGCTSCGACGGAGQSCTSCSCGG